MGCAALRGFTHVSWGRHLVGVVLIRSIVLCIRLSGEGVPMMRAGGVSGAHLAAWSGGAATLQRLLAAAPSLMDEPSAAGLSPLEYAALGGHEGCVHLLEQGLRLLEDGVFAAP